MTPTARGMRPAAAFDAEITAYWLQPVDLGELWR